MHRRPPALPRSTAAHRATRPCGGVTPRAPTTHPAAATGRNTPGAYPATGRVRGRGLGELPRSVAGHPAARLYGPPGCGVTSRVRTARRGGGDPRAVTGRNVPGVCRATRRVLGRGLGELLGSAAGHRAARRVPGRARGRLPCSAAGHRAAWLYGAPGCGVTSRVPAACPGGDEGSCACTGWDVSGAHRATRRVLGRARVGLPRSASGHRVVRLHGPSSARGVTSPAPAACPGDGEPGAATGRSGPGAYRATGRAGHAPGGPPRPARLPAPAGRGRRAPSGTHPGFGPGDGRLAGAGAGREGGGA